MEIIEKLKSTTLRKTYNMRRGNVIARKGLLALVSSLRGALDRFSARLVVSREEAGRRPQDFYGNQALLEIAGKTAKLGGWVVHLPDRRIEWSDETSAIHERQRGETVTLEEGLGYFAPEWRETITSHFEACVATGLPFDLEVEIIAGTGRRKWVRAIGVAIRDDQGQIARIQGALQDIDEGKRLENTARDLERRFAESMENISDAFFRSILIGASPTLTIRPNDCLSALVRGFWAA